MILMEVKMENYIIQMYEKGISLSYIKKIYYSYYKRNYEKPKIKAYEEKKTKEQCYRYVCEIILNHERERRFLEEI